MGLAEWAMVCALSLIWSVSYLFNAMALRNFAPLTLVALRLSLGAIALWLIAGAVKYPFPRDPRLWLRFVAMGILNNAIPFSLIVWSQFISLRAWPRSSTPRRLCSPCWWRTLSCMTRN